MGSQIFKKEQLMQTIKVLFPHDGMANRIPPPDDEEIPLFKEELIAAARKIKEKKAFGPDGIPPD